MSVTTESNNDTVGNALQEPVEKSPSRRRVLLYAVAPVGLLILLMTGVRFVTEAAQNRESQDSAQTEQALRSIRPNDPGSRPTPIPVITYKADKATQAALEVVVRGQLQAIGDQDFEKALTFAIPEMRTGTQPAQFASMIRNGFSAMLSAKKITILPATIRGRKGGMQQAQVETEVLTEAGQVARFGYLLISDADGWHVATVMPDRNAMMNREMNREENPAPAQDKEVSKNIRNL